MAETSPSPNALGKKPRWYLTDDELLRIPSRMSGMDSTQELKYRREAAGFIQEMAERLNQNVPNQRGKINQNCIGIAMVHMHRFFIVHSFRVFDPKDVAAACLFLAGKSEECPRKLEHVVEVWFKLKHRKAEVQPPFNDTVKKNGTDLIALLEGILLQTIGFELQVDLPHPIVVKNMQNFKLANPKLVDCAYWFASDIIQLTNWCIRYNEKTIACVCIYLACTWADYEIPETACSPWFKTIEPEMTQELLDKLTDEFTFMYKDCSDCHARRFIQTAKNGNPATMPAKAIAKLPPPPTPPVFQQASKRIEDNEKQKPPIQRKDAGFTDTMARGIKRSPKSMDDGKVPVTPKKHITTPLNNQVLTPEKNSTLNQQTSEHIRLPQIKQEATSPASSSSPMIDKLAEKDGIAAMANRKKIAFSEYKQRIKNIKQVTPTDSPVGQAATSTITTNFSTDLKPDDNGLTPSSTDGEQKTSKRQSFFPDFSNATSSHLGSDSLELPVGIALIEKEKTKKHEQPSINRNQHQLQRPAKQDTELLDERYATTSTDRSQHHTNNRKKHDRSHEQQHYRKENSEKHHKSHHHDVNPVSEETKRISNGVSIAYRDFKSHRECELKGRNGSNGDIVKEQHRYHDQRSQQQTHATLLLSKHSIAEHKSIESSPMTPTPPPLPTVSAHELEEGEVL